MAASGEIYQVTFQGILNGQTVENVLHFRALTGLITDSAIKAGVERFWFLTKQLQCSGYSYNQMIVKRMTPVPLDESLVIPSTVSTGTGSGGCLQNSVAAVFTLRTGFSGKSHRGRIYFAGIATDLLASGWNLFTTAGGVAMASAASNLLSEFGPSGTNTAVALGVYSRLIGGSHPFTVAGWQQVTGIDPQPILGNQRRRRIGVGI